ncbi:4Fe-4S dicluster domain-containing protein [Microlunatus elymi]|uniref:4Fe-4S dicluster domain-containing protein n=1 Tax=Microlunatus elymi TaxID=2596828 RepID=A0A516PVM8_9ACTN|nr:4Fe-4S binding protein [Microlunatus elymi]QDP95223.1 4Fe-4S dicluster domain-containing protein [Microlunatus elymi]
MSDLPASTNDVDHGAIKLIEENCTSCMICARECPSWCISIDSHTEPIADLPPGARERTTNVLDRFAIDWSLCMFCGICVEECPFDALEWAAEPVAGQPSPAGLVHEIEDLR